MTTSPAAATDITTTLRRVMDVIRERVFGQDPVIEHLLVTFLARGHALVEGVPGTAKTMLVRSLAGALGLRFKRVQFTPDLMPADIVGVGIMREIGRGFEFREGPVFTDILLGDEINRAPPKTQSALLEAMGERQVTVDGVDHRLGGAFTVFATQNPVEYEGTYPLPEAQLDRFLLKITVPYPSHEAELAILDNYAAGFDAERAEDVVPAPVLGENEARTLRTLVDGVTVAPEIRAYATKIIRATREEPLLVLGGSPRATVALFRAARALALLEGRNYVTPNDVKSLAPAVLRHRVTLTPEQQVEGRSPDDVISAILARVAAPQ